MDKFDQWYNKKMDEQKIAYSESFWDSFSQQLNQLPGSGKRRRPFMYIWILSLIVIIGGGSIFAWQSYSNPSAEQEVFFSTEEETTPVRSSSNDKSDESNEINTSSEPLAANVSPESPGIKTESTSSRLDPGYTGKNSTSKASISQSKENSIAERSLTSKSNDSAMLNKSAMQKSVIAQPSNENEISENQGTLAEDIFAKETSSTIANSANENSQEISDVILKNEPNTTSASSENTLVTSGQLAENLVISRLHSELRSLEPRALVLPQVSFLSEHLDGLKPTLVECCPFKGWTHHVELGAQFFPGVNEGSRFFTGLQAAYHLQFRWAQRWSASAGAGVLQRWGSFGGFQDSPQDIYTNTRVRRGFLLVPTSATYMQIPTMVNFHAGKHIIGAGVRTLFLVGIQGQLDEYQLQRNENEVDFSFSSNTVNTGWINDNGFRSIVPEYMLSYSYQFNTHLSVSVSGAWMPNGIVFAEKNSDNLDIPSSLALESGSSQQPFLLEDKWQVGISLRYKF